MNALYKAFNDDNELLYIGISMRAAQRFHEHGKFSGWFEEVSKITVEWFPSREDAMDAEREAIIKYHPKYNIQHNGKKSKHSKTADDFDADGVTAKIVDGHYISAKRVELQPVYKLQEVAALLGCSGQRVSQYIDNGELGAMEWSRNTRKVKDSDEIREYVTYRVSGWQILDFLDSKGARR